MSSNNTHVSMKDKIKAHLPGHKNQDANHNGVPDRLEKNNTTGTRSLSDLNGNGVPDRLERNASLAAPVAALPGSTVIPGSTAQTTTTTTTSNRDGLPISGNVLRDEVVQQSTIRTEPALLQTAPLQGSALPLSQDLNRNGIPDQLEGQGFGFIGSTTVSNQSFVDVREAPVIVEKIEKPAVIHEVLKTEEVIEVQPIIEREREKLDVYEVVQPMREREVIATEIREAVLPTQTRATIVEDQSAFLAQRSLPAEISTREVAATMSQTIENAPIIHETILHKVIEEVQPVLYKEIDRPILIKETLPIYEKIVEAPHLSKTVLPIKDLGTRGASNFGYVQGLTTASQTGFQQGYVQQGSALPLSQDLNRNGVPDSLERSGSFGQGYAQGSALPLSQDLNRNGVPDSLERQGSYGQGLAYGQQGLSQGSALPFSQDLNRNGVPDSLERSGSYGLNQGLSQGSALPLSQDLNRNGVPDSMERSGSYGLNRSVVPEGDLLSAPVVHHTDSRLDDFNGNGIPDSMERSQLPLGQDLNKNGIPDSLERGMQNATLNDSTTF